LRPLDGRETLAEDAGIRARAERRARLVDRNRSRVATTHCLERRRLVDESMREVEAPSEGPGRSDTPCEQRERFAVLAARGERRTESKVDIARLDELALSGKRRRPLGEPSLLVALPSSPGDE